MKDIQLTHAMIGTAMDAHRCVGAGLLEAVYKECLAMEFTLLGIPFKCQKPIPVVYNELKLECGYRLDFLVVKTRSGGDQIRRSYRSYT
jgi:GxxExxY protein